MGEQDQKNIVSTSLQKAAGKKSRKIIILASILVAALLVLSFFIFLRPEKTPSTGEVDIQVTPGIPDSVPHKEPVLPAGG